MDAKNEVDFHNYISDNTETYEKSETVDLNHPNFDSSSHKAYEHLDI